MTRSSDQPRQLACLALLALGACATALTSGVGASLAYLKESKLLEWSGLTLQHLRPVHESAALAWVFLGGAVGVHLYLQQTFPSLSDTQRRVQTAQTLLWTVAGMGIVLSLLAGRFTGREYLGYQPIFSLVILAGWLLFAWTYFSRVGFRLRGRPVYVYMWSIAIPLFIITYGEAHLYLLEQVSRMPLRDLAIQWKAYGTMVGSFNLLAYGTLMYVVGRLRDDDSYAYSPTAFALFFVGLLNTFTNYGHHTYHLPQSAWIHWISFLVSMLELIILAKVFLDLLALRNRTSPSASTRVADLFVVSGTVWTFLMLVLALAISIPPVNALIHGTHVVVAHSMGAMLGIDSMILWAALALLVRRLVGSEHPVVTGRRVRWAIPLLSVLLAVFLASFLAHGIAWGSIRYLGSSAPDFSVILKMFPGLIVVSGLALALTGLWMIGSWMAALLGALRRDALDERSQSDFTRV